jgi:hypothetical protein
MKPFKKAQEYVNKRGEKKQIKHVNRAFCLDRLVPEDSGKSGAEYRKNAQPLHNFFVPVIDKISRC